MKIPYKASNERSALIRNNYRKISRGCTLETLLKHLPDPDEIPDLYEPKIYNPRKIGETYWYIIKRAPKKGDERILDEKLVRVSVDREGRVTQVDRWGF